LNLSESGERPGWRLSESAARICGLPSRPEPHPICRIEDRNGQVVVRVNANSVRPSDRRRRLIAARVRWKSRASHLTEPTSRATQGKRQAVFGNVDALAHGSSRCEAVVLVSQGRSAGAGSSAHHPGRSAAPAALLTRDDVASRSQQRQSSSRITCRHCIESARASSSHSGSSNLPAHRWSSRAPMCRGVRRPCIASAGMQARRSRWGSASS
jgi:hypothetical protein